MKSEGMGTLAAHLRVETNKRQEAIRTTDTRGFDPSFFHEARAFIAGLNFALKKLEEIQGH